LNQVIGSLLAFPQQIASFSDVFRPEKFVVLDGRPHCIAEHNDIR
jgi:hypothetical protein